jgi:Lar family restriction alleviation protein
MGSDLKPCPFCGATVPYMESAYEDRMHGEVVVYNVQCQQCCAAGPAQDSYYKAAKAWGDVSARHSRAEAAEARAALAEADLDALARTVGAAIVESALAPGESLTEPPRHAIVATVCRLRARAEAAEQLADSWAAADAALSAAHEEYEASKANIAVAQAERDVAEARAAQAEAMYASTLWAWAQARAEGKAAGAARERAAVVAYLRAEARKMDPNHSGVYEGREGDADHMCGLAESIRDGEHVAPTDGGEQ